MNKGEGFEMECVRFIQFKLGDVMIFSFFGNKLAW